MNGAHLAALAALQAGLSTIPPRTDGSKAPIAEWKQYQSRLPSESEIASWYRNGQTGVGLITGAVSGNLECLDFDDREAWQEFKRAAQAAGLVSLLGKVASGYGEQSPHGYHLLYRCEEISGNTKLTQGADKKTLIETRGEGGFIIVAPSSGKVNSAGDYVLKAGGFDSIATVTPAERGQLLSLARTLDKSPRKENPASIAPGSGDRLGDNFNRKYSWPEILEPHGWQAIFERGGTTHWRRPGKDDGESATTNHDGSDLLWVFSTSTVFESERSYDRFGAHVLLDYNGDFKSAARALRSSNNKPPPQEEPPPWGEENTGQCAPQPLFKDIPPAAPYPMDAIGDIGSKAAKEIQRIIKAPPAMCGQSVLAAMAQIAQSYADISIDGRRRPVSCFFTSVGETGERKSGVDEVALKPHNDYEKKLEDEYKLEHSEWEREHMAWKMARDEGLKKVKGKHSKMQHMDEMGDAPLEPVQPALLIEEPTYEGLIKVLQFGRPSVGLFTDEGGRFIGGHAMNSENALKTAAGLSSLWDRGVAKRTRSGDGHASLRGKRVSMHIMVQGLVAEMIMGNDIFREQGLLSRVLMTWPETTVGNRPYVEENVFTNPDVKAYHDACEKLLQKPLPKDETNELNPPVLKLTKSAKRLWVQFHDYCDKEAGAGGELEIVKGLANKAPEHAARLAGVLAVFEDETSISVELLESGIKLMNYYLTEAVRIAGVGMIGSEMRDAAALLEWLQEKGHHLIYPVLIYQHAPIRKLREKKAAMKVIETLENHGWLARTDVKEVDGKRRREVWRMTDV
jgi:hypothetical protein